MDTDDEGMLARSFHSSLDGDPATPPFPSDEHPEADPATLEPCWRCKREITTTKICPYCRARPRFEQSPAPEAFCQSFPVLPFYRVLIGYAIMMAPAIVWSWVLNFKPPLSPSDIEAGTVALEVFDSVLTLILLIWIGRLHAEQPPSEIRLASWLMSLPLLFGVLLFNFAYHRLLRTVLRLENLEIPGEEWSILAIVIFAVQPAIIEELFFRYLALGALLRITGTHVAVLVSAVMFALAHVYQPLGLPWLLLMGMVLGYARLGSGGLVLPVLMHFTHNLIILWLEVTP